MDKIQKKIKVKIVQKRDKTIVTNSCGSEWIFTKCFDAELALGVLVARTLSRTFHNLFSTRDTFELDLTIK